jgi:N12 class adenine-specific DNA methylase/2'-5' RNA ligase
VADANKQKELLKSILVSDSSPNDIKAKAWDSFMAAQDSASFRGSFDSLPLDNMTKRRLYFLKFPQSYNITPPERRDLGGHKELSDFIGGMTQDTRQTVGVSTDPSTKDWATMRSAEPGKGAEPPAPMDPAYAEFDKKYKLELPNLATRMDVREISPAEYGQRPAVAAPAATVPAPAGADAPSFGISDWLKMSFGNRDSAKKVFEGIAAGDPRLQSAADFGTEEFSKYQDRQETPMIPLSKMFADQPASSTEEYFKRMAQAAESLTTPGATKTMAGFVAAPQLAAMKSVSIAQGLYQGMVTVGAATAGVQTARSVHAAVEKMMAGDTQGAAGELGQATFEGLMAALLLHSTKNGYQKTAEWAKAKMGGSGEPPAAPGDVTAGGGVANPPQAGRPGGKMGSSSAGPGGGVRPRRGSGSSAGSGPFPQGGLSTPSAPEPIKLPSSILDDIAKATEASLGGGRSTTISGPGIRTTSGETGMAPSPGSKPTRVIEKDPPANLTEIINATPSGPRPNSASVEPPTPSGIIGDILAANPSGSVPGAASRVPIAPGKQPPRGSAPRTSSTASGRPRNPVNKPPAGGQSPPAVTPTAPATAGTPAGAGTGAGSGATGALVEGIMDATAARGDVAAKAGKGAMQERPPADIDQQTGHSVTGEPPRPMSDAGAAPAKGGKIPASTLPPEDQTDELDQIVEITRGNIEAIQQDPAIFDDPENVAILKEQIEEAKAKLESNKGADPAVRDALRSVLDDAGSMIEKKRTTLHQSATTQIDLPQGTADVIRKGAAEVDEDDLVGKGRENEPHITVKYGLKGDALEQVKKTLADMPPITVSLGKTSLFEGAEQDVVKVDVDSPELQAIHEAIKKSVPNEESFPEYKPHVTVAYVKPGRGKKYAGKDFAEGRSLTIDAISFRDENGKATSVKLGGVKQSGMGTTDVAPPKDKAPGAPVGGKAPIEIAQPPSADTGKTPQATKGGGEGAIKPPQPAPQGSTAGPGKSGTFTEPPAPIAPPKTAPKPEEPKVAAKPPAPATSGSGVKQPSRNRPSVTRWLGRGVNTGVRVRFKGDEDSWLFDLVAATKKSMSGDPVKRQGYAEDYDRFAKKVAKDYGVSEPDARGLMRDYHSAVREQAKGMPPDYDGDPIDVPSFDEFAKQQIAAGKGEPPEKQTEPQATPEAGPKPEQKAKEKQPPKPAPTPEPPPPPAKTETPSKVGTNKGDGERIPLTLLKTTNTKTGTPIFAVQLPKQYPDDVYRRLKDKATELGGYWSRFPASKGFHFKSEAAANKMLEAFGNPVSGGAEPKQPETKPSTATEPPKPLTEKSERPASDAAKKEDQPDATGSTIKAGEQGDAAEKPKTQTTAGQRAPSAEKPTQAEAGGADASGSEDRGPLEGEPSEGSEGTAKAGSTGVGYGGGGGNARPGSPQRDGKRTGEAGSAESGEQDVPVSAGGKRGGEPGSGSDPAIGDVAKDKPKTAAPKPPKQPDHVIQDEDGVGAGGFDTRVNNNMAAVRLLKKLEEEGRTDLTEGERKILSLYSGWGGLNKLFKAGYWDDFEKHGGGYSGWSGGELYKKQREFFELVGQKAYQDAMDSSINANYTSPEVIKLHWELMRQLGVKEGGRWLESSAGVGLYLGLQPLDMTIGTKRAAVELDPTSGGIAKLLYPNANVSIKGFEKTKYPHNFFDYAVTNVPFADIRIADKDYRKESWMTANTHNYFIGKNIDLVKPGGIVSVISTSSSLDSIKATKFREEMAKKADFVGAIRLPQDTFSKNAGASVTTDILIFRKRHEGEQPGGEPWVNTVEVDLPNNGGTVRMNEYFQKHPEMILGNLDVDRRYHKPGEGIGIPSVQGKFTEEAFREAMARLPKDIFNAGEVVEPPAAILGVSEVPEAGETREDGFVIRNGEVYVRKGELFRKVDTKPREKKVIEKYLTVRDAVRDVHRVQADRKATDFEVKTAQRNLKAKYDAFVKEFGYVNDSANEKIIEPDSDSSGVLALEHYIEYKERLPLQPGQKRAQFKKHVEVRLADIFTERVIPLTSDKIESGDPLEAVKSSVNLFGRIHWGKIEKATGMPKDEIVRVLKGELFLDPDKNEYVLASHYLAGRVKDKLKKAIEAAKFDSAFKENVEALRAVIPADRSIDGPGITITLGGPWIPSEVYEEFIDHIAGDEYYTSKKGVTVRHAAEAGYWSVEAPTHKTTTKARDRWGTSRVDAVELIQLAMNQKSPVVYDKDADGNRFKNDTATIEAQAKQEAIREEFSRWVVHDYHDKARMQRLFNDTFNAEIEPTFDGSNLTLPGMSTAGLRGGWPDKHQLNAIARTTQEPSTLIAHPVGYGKTLVLVATAMEWRRLGLAKKPLMMVPNSLVAKTRAEILERYPQARVLTVSSQDVQEGNREKIVARISTGNYDVILMSDETFKRIPSSEAMIRDYYDTELAEIDAQLAELAVDDGVKNLQELLDDDDAKAKREASLAFKNLLKHRRRTKALMEKRLEATEKDKGVLWETLGIDGIIVDEAHMLKNLAFSTKMSGVKGIQHSGNGLTADFTMKLDHIRKMSGGRNVVLATGTPILNTMGELFAMQRYLIPDKLREMGIYHFDAWAAMFGKVQKVRDVKADNKGFNIVNRFSKFVNGQALVGLTRSFMDLPPADTVKIPVPKLKGGARTVVVCEGGQPFEDYKDVITHRMEVVKSGKFDPRLDNLLKITGDARKAAMDMRLHDPSLPPPPNGKAAKAVEKIFSIWEETDEQKGTQLVFADLSVPNRNKKGADVVEEADENLSPEEEEEAWLNEEGEEESEAGDTDRFSMYEEIKRGLIERGVPENEIAFIHDYKTRADKLRLTAAMNSGLIRVLIGSTGKMGVGMNVQQRLKALHHLDAPWRPGDMLQREGRILRQGNMFDEVEIINYVTSGSFDSFMYDAIERKARFIVDLLSGRVAMDEFEDVDDTVLSFKQIKLMASGNLEMQEQGEIELRLMELGAMRRGYENSRFTLRHEVATLPGVVKGLKAQAEAGRAAIEKMEKEHPASDGEFSLQSLKGRDVEAEFIKAKDDEQKITEVKTKAGDAIFAKVRSLHESGQRDAAPVAVYRGVEIWAKYLHDQARVKSDAPEGRPEVKFDPQFVEITYRIPGTNSYMPAMEGHNLQSESSLGLIQTIQNHVNTKSMAKYVESDEEMYKRKQAQLESAKEELDRPWEKQEEYDRLMMRNVELRRLLGLDEDQETGDVDDDGGDGGGSEPPKPRR